MVGEIYQVVGIYLTPNEYIKYLYDISPSFREILKQQFLNICEPHFFEKVFNIVTYTVKNGFFFFKECKMHVKDNITLFKNDDPEYILRTVCEIFDNMFDNYFKNLVMLNNGMTIESPEDLKIVKDPKSKEYWTTNSWEYAAILKEHMYGYKITHDISIGDDGDVIIGILAESFCLGDHSGVPSIDIDEIVEKSKLVRDMLKDTTFKDRKISVYNVQDTCTCC